MGGGGEELSRSCDILQLSYLWDTWLKPGNDSQKRKLMIKSLRRLRALSGKIFDPGVANDIAAKVTSKSVESYLFERPLLSKKASKIFDIIKSQKNYKNTEFWLQSNSYTLKYKKYESHSNFIMIVNKFEILYIPPN